MVKDREAGMLQRLGLQRVGHDRTIELTDWASLVVQMVKNLPLEEGIAAHSSILAWRSPWTEEPGRLQSLGLQRGGHS